MKDCIFCKIVKGEIPCHRILEDDNHLAFLSIYPNTEGVTVVIPKSHQHSYIFETDDKVMLDLMAFSKRVAKKIDNTYEDVGRCGVVFEGFGVDHLHTKLFPLHGTNIKEWEKIESTNNNAYFEKYPGYVSSNDSYKADDAELAKIAERIRNAAE
jgi:histidine triad (HIT) family protein